MGDEDGKAGVDFQDTMTRVSSVEQAKIEKYAKQRDEARRKPWYRRAEDRDAAEAEQKRMRRDEIQKWVILLMLFLSLLIGDSKVFQMAKSLVIG